MKTRENVGTTRPGMTSATPQRRTKRSAFSEPWRRRRSADAMLGFCPVFLNSGPGSNVRTMPEYEASSSSGVILRGPCAGSER